MTIAQHLGGARYVLRCECGRRSERLASWIAAAVSPKSCSADCGLSATPSRGPSPLAKAGRILKCIRQSAARAAIPVTVTTADLVEAVVDRPCAYCGGEVARVGASGVDRVDNRFGYEPGNVCACCKFCNDAKGHLLGADEFRAAMAVRVARTGLGHAWDGFGYRDVGAKRVFQPPAAIPVAADDFG